ELCTMRAVIAVLLTTATISAHAEPLSIHEAIRLGLSRNERAAIAGQQVAAAEARVDRARAFFFPDLTARGTYTRRGHTVQDQKQDALFAQASSTLTLLDVRAFPLYRRAKLERDAERDASSNDRRLLAFEVADAFLSTLSLDALEDAAKTRLD